jgi:hypothetical protein
LRLGWQAAIGGSPSLASVSFHNLPQLNVSISGKGTADQLDEFTILTYASFQCPEGVLADISVKVDQPSTGSTGFGRALETCRVGPNTVVIRVVGAGVKAGWDIAKAHAVWSITAGLDSDQDEKDIMITAP